MLYQRIYNQSCNVLHMLELVCILLFHVVQSLFLLPIISSGLRIQIHIFTSHISGCVNSEDWMKSNSPERSEAEANKMHCEDTKTQIHTVTVTINISVLIKATEGNHTSLLLFIFMDLSFVLWLKEIHNFSLLKCSSAHTRMKKINDVLFLFFNSLNHNFCINLQYFWSEGGEQIHIYYRASGC